MADLRVSGLGGIPKGATADRPLSPSIGDVFYNGQLEILEIYNGNTWSPCSAPAGQPTITVTDVGTNVAYGSAQASVAFIEGPGGPAEGFTAFTVTGESYTNTSSTSPVIVTVGNNGNYIFGGTAYNTFGVGQQSNNSPTITLTTVPQAPTIGTATLSGASNSVTVTWTINSDGGKNLSSISIIPYLNGTTAQTAATAATTNSTSHTFTTLTLGATYTFKVKTTNANGDGLESQATNSITIPTSYISYTSLLIGGGGNGANNWGAGGGGGEVKESTQNIGSGIVATIAIGAGANDSSITYSGFTNTAVKGGSSTGEGGTGESGACGAGGSRGAAGGVGTVHFKGGNSTSNSTGGGGGSGAVGVDGSGNNSGAGGIGTNTYSTWATATSSGVSGRFAGGGGGGAGNSNIGGAGGTGGGGVGGNQGGAGNGGTANTGGGAGGGGNNFGGAASGGSGLALLRFTGSYTATATTGSPTRVESGGFTYYKFTGNGTLTA